MFPERSLLWLLWRRLGELTRAAQISAVRYDLALDVTRRDTVAGHVTMRLHRKGTGDVNLDFRGQDVKVSSVNGAAARGVEWYGSHLRIPVRFSDIRSPLP